MYGYVCHPDSHALLDEYINMLELVTPPLIGQCSEFLNQIYGSVYKWLRNLVFFPWVNNTGSGLG